MENQELTLEQLAAQAPEGTGIDTQKRRLKADVQMNVAYPVEITEEVTETSEKGFTTYKPTLRILKQDGGTLDLGRVALVLPVFGQDLRNSRDEGDLEKMKQTFGQRLHGFLRAVRPQLFNAYASIDKSSKNWRFLDEAGQEIDREVVNDRNVMIGKAVMAVATGLSTSSVSYKGSKLWYVRTPHPQKEGDYYNNFYSEQPHKYPASTL